MQVREMTKNSHQKLVTKVNGKDENTVEVNGLSLVFFSFSQKKTSMNMASLGENKALILHAGLSTAEDSDQ